MLTDRKAQRRAAMQRLGAEGSRVRWPVSQAAPGLKTSEAEGTARAAVEVERKMLAAASSFQQKQLSWTRVSGDSIDRTQRYGELECSSQSQFLCRR